MCVPIGDKNLRLTFVGYLTRDVTVTATGAHLVSTTSEDGGGGRGEKEGNKGGDHC